MKTLNPRLFSDLSRFFLFRVRVVGVVGPTDSSHHTYGGLDVLYMTPDPRWFSLYY